MDNNMKELIHKGEKDLHRFDQIQKIKKVVASVTEVGIHLVGIYFILKFLSYCL